MSTVSLTKVTLCALAISSSLPVFSASAKDFTEQAFRSQPLGHGVYELAYDNSQKTLYAASAPSFEKDKTTGVVFRLAADSLQINQKIATERRTFALSLDEENHILYLGNALDGSLTLVDTLTNKVIKTIQLSDDADPEKQAHVREVVLDKQNQRLYVSGIGRKDKGLLWVVDTRKQQLSETLNHLEPVGFAVDDAGNKVYVVTGNGELVTLDGKTSKLLARVKVDPAEPDHYFLNIALNSTAGVGYIADTNTRDVLVVLLAPASWWIVLPRPIRSPCCITPRAMKSMLPIATIVRLASSTQKPIISNTPSKRRPCPTVWRFLRMPERFMPASNRTKKATRLITFSRLI